MMNIRAATPADHEAILALVPRLSAVGVPPWRDAAQMIAADTASVREALDGTAPGSQVLVADEDGSVAGFIHLMPITDYYSGRELGHVADLVVAPAAEGRGLGRALMAAGEAWARERGYPMMTLNVLVGNTGPMAMYERLGFAAEWTKYVKPLE